ncbi:hypothetical protein [Hwanghaeella sp.]|uniref:hypothetical protein n=1 Tax=Hwanghaeella sp. TaxID=2605943 RepID=UPI003CCBD826
MKYVEDGCDGAAEDQCIDENPCRQFPDPDPGYYAVFDYDRPCAFNCIPRHHGSKDVDRGVNKPVCHKGQKHTPNEIRRRQVGSGQNMTDKKVPHGDQQGSPREGQQHGKKDLIFKDEQEQEKSGKLQEGDEDRFGKVPGPDHPHSYRFRP